MHHIFEYQFKKKVDLILALNLGVNVSCQIKMYILEQNSQPKLNPFNNHRKYSNPNLNPFNSHVTQLNLLDPLI